MTNQNVRNYTSSLDNHKKVQYMVAYLLSHGHRFILIHNSNGIQITLTHYKDDPQSIFSRAVNHAWHMIEEAPLRECGNSTDDYE